MELNILHIDMDAFYAAIEIRDNSKLKDKPVIVGGTSKRGVVSTASYEARKYGIHSAMPVFKAKQLCPNGIYLKPDHQKYKKISSQIRNIFTDFTDLIEPLALDEAFLDVSNNEMNSIQIGRKIKRRIRKEIKLTASIGVSYNKFLAKFASDFNKPDGFKIISPQDVNKLLKDLNVEKLWGVGPKTADKLKQYNLTKIHDIVETDPSFLINKFGKKGYRIYQLAQGKDKREVTPPKMPKSIGKETTFQQDIADKEVLTNYLEGLSEQVAQRVQQRELYGRTVTLKLKDEDFTIYSRSKTVSNYINTKKEIYFIVSKLLANEILKKKIRLIGVTLSNLKRNIYQQLKLFD
ncbi:DNA polymerase IV [Sporohalobacter salinus]|uniref:DNA polymerase IV n=1 Tax=Sporohalobacter salinus TaxID=1494606 RepID=UPI00195F7A67|nr:DNA polymerase IV [Sporohalobacter salinus]MBM7624125.1 DNA polymerase-4 [Sporohalobacter salinus]